MKLVAPLVAVVLLLLAGCSFDASSRPIPPAPATVITNESQAYCCGSCAIEDEQAVCTGCQRTGADSCSGNSQRLLCVTNRVEEPESQTAFRVTCF